MKTGFWLHPLHAVNAQLDFELKSLPARSNPLAFPEWYLWYTASYCPALRGGPATV